MTINALHPSLADREIERSLRGIQGARRDLADDNAEHERLDWLTFERIVAVYGAYDCVLQIAAIRRQVETDYVMRQVGSSYDAADGELDADILEAAAQAIDRDKFLWAKGRELAVRELKGAVARINP